MLTYDLGHKLPLPRYFVGLDLGQARDFSAVAIVERGTERHDVEESPTFNVRHLERWKLGSPYPQIVEDVAQMLKRAPLGNNKAHEPMLAIDATGVGMPVVDMFKRERLLAELRPVIITGGDQANWSRGIVRLPKRHLVAVIQVALQSDKLKIAKSLPEATTLAQELRDFRVTLTEAANDTYGGRQGSNDDLVLAVALALWAAQRRDPPNIPCSSGRKALRY